MDLSRVFLLPAALLAASNFNTTYWCSTPHAVITKGPTNNFLNTTMGRLQGEGEINIKQEPRAKAAKSL
jgi:hypothetical protein